MLVIKDKADFVTTRWLVGMASRKLKCPLLRGCLFFHATEPHTIIHTYVRTYIRHVHTDIPFYGDQTCYQVSSS